MIKKIVVYMCALVLLLSITACQGNDTDSVSSASVVADLDISSAQDLSSKKEVSSSSNISSAVSTTSSAPSSAIAVSSTPKDTSSKKQEIHKHSFGNATCTQPATCACGATSGDILGHNYSPATCTSPKKCNRCGVTLGNALGHNYSYATCTAPKKCTRCGVTSGNALGHSYTTATCQKPKTCQRCGITSGDVAAHNYSDATCQKAKTCTVCGITTGVKLEHKWQEATYTSPKKCSLCGKTEGSALTPVMTGISIATLPAKTVYNISEEFDPTGLTINLNYSNGDKKSRDNNFEVTGFSSAKIGKCVLTVTYSNFTTTFTIDIVAEDILLCKMTPFDLAYSGIKQNLYDTYGNYYDRCVYLTANKGGLWSTGHDSYITYRLAGNYTRLRTTIALQNDISEGSLILNIYADDKLIYTKQGITYYTEPFDIDIDITNCNFLKLYATSGSGRNRVLLGNAELIK